MYIAVGFLAGCLTLLSLQALYAQTQVPLNVVTGQSSRGAALPQYVVYRHFLGWIVARNDEAKAKGVTDPYAFAAPFSDSTGLQKAELDTLLNEAQSLTADLRAQDARASAVVASYRSGARSAVSAGNPLPPPPPELRTLQQGRTAILIRHYVHLQKKLGAQSSSKLDGYISRDFTPHMSLRSAFAPPSRVPVVQDRAGFSSTVK